MTQRARDRYPNIAALAQGLMSGSLASPSLKTEARELLEEVDRMHRLVEYADDVGKPDYFLRWLAVGILLLLVAVFLATVRFGMHS